MLPDRNNKIDPNLSPPNECIRENQEIIQMQNKKFIRNQKKVFQKNISTRANYARLDVCQSQKPEANSPKFREIPEFFQN